VLKEASSNIRSNGVTCYCHWTFAVSVKIFWDWLTIIIKHVECWFVNILQNYSAITGFSESVEFVNTQHKTFNITTCFVLRFFLSNRISRYTPVWKECWKVAKKWLMIGKWTGLWRKQWHSDHCLWKVTTSDSVDKMLNEERLGKNLVNSPYNLFPWGTFHKFLRSYDDLRLS